MEDKDRPEDEQGKDIILTFCAHNDDHLLGAGGTLAKYAKEGKIFKTYVFSFGESSHPWLKRNETAKMRVKEAQKAEKILGGEDLRFFGIKEGEFGDRFKTFRFRRKLKKIILDNNPSKIFTHSLDDPHPDHRAVYNAVMQVADDINYKGDIYSFNIWNPINVRKRDKPKMVVDISASFEKKLQAFKVHESQKMTLITLWWDIYRRDRWNGLVNRCKYAEIFYKVR